MLGLVLRLKLPAEVNLVLKQCGLGNWLLGVVSSTQGEGRRAGTSNLYSYCVLFDCCNNMLR